MEFDITKYKEYKENNRIEAKKALNGLPSSIWETYSAFANTYGGIILLGVEETKDGSFVSAGLKDEAWILKDFWNSINNFKTVSTNILSDRNVEVFHEDNGDVIIAIEIPRADRTDRPIYIKNDLYGGTFRRNYEGDYHCSKREVRAMLRDEPDEGTDGKVIENVLWQDLCLDTLHAYRRRHEIHSPGHPWEKLSDDQYLIMLGAASKEADGNIHATAAGLLMFGYEHQITREYPEYFLDYREYDSFSSNDWIDRVYSTTGTWSGNIYDFFFRITEKLYKQLKVPFKLEMVEGVMTRIDDTPVHKAVREALVNCIINADFFIPSGVIILSKPGLLSFSNPGDIRIGKYAMLHGGVSDARNKTIMKMFTLLGIGERAGSGVPRIFDVWEQEGFKTPVIEEDLERIRTTLYLSLENDKKSAIKIGDKKSAINFDEKPRKKSKYEEIIIEYLNETESASTVEIASHIGLKDSRTRQLLNEMSKNGLIIASGSNRNRRYEAKTKDKN